MSSVQIVRPRLQSPVKSVKLSIVIPVHNEEQTIETVLQRVQQVALEEIEREIIVVDDGSTDGTFPVLQRFDGSIRILRHPTNLGKGAAVRSGFQAATGDILLIQDADLEYDPNDYPALIAPILQGQADAVMGSRFLTQKPRFFTKSGDPFFSHYFGNKLIIWLTNFLYRFRATDYEGCYKAFTREVIQETPVTTNGFDFDNELICKLLRKKCRIVEVPIHYHPRLYSEGKKIRWQHGVQMVWSIIKWRLKKEVPGPVGAPFLPPQRAGQRRAILWAGALVIVSLGVRLAVNRAPERLVGDAVGHEAKAVSLLRRQGYAMNGRPTSFKPPGYPAFLAAIYWMFGHDHRAVVWVQSVLGAAVCLLTVGIANRLGLPAWVGWLAGLLVAVCPSLVGAAGLLLSETLVCFLLALGIWVGLWWWQEKRGWQAAVWGLVMGVLILTRSAMVGFPLVWLAVAIHKQRQQTGGAWLRFWLQAAMGALLCFSVVGAWTWRNWGLHHRLVPVSTDGGRSFYASYRVPDGYRFGLNPQDGVTAQADAMSSEVERDRFYYAAAFDWIRAHLGELPRLTVLKLAFLGSPWDWELIGRDGRARYNWVFGLTLPFLLIGLFVLPRTPEAGWLLAPLGYVLLWAILFYGSPRFRLPFEPYLLIVASLGMAEVFRWGRSWSVPASVIAADIASNTVLVALAARFHR